MDGITFTSSSLNVLEGLNEVHDEPRGRAAVDDAVVVGQASGSIRRGSMRSSRTTGLSAPRPRPRMATSGLLTMGVKCAPPMPPWFEMVNVPPFSSSAATLRSRAFFGQLFKFLRQLEQALLVHVANDRDDQTRPRCPRRCPM